MSLLAVDASHKKMARPSIGRAIGTALELFDTTEQCERFARSEIEDHIDNTLACACEILHCKGRIDSLSQKRLIGSESLCALEMVFHIQPGTTSAGAKYNAPVVRDVRHCLSEAAAKIARICSSDESSVSVNSVDWQRDYFVASITWILTQEAVEGLASARDRKTAETVARLKTDADENAARYELESELVRVEMAEGRERLESAIAERTRSHNSSRGGGGRGLRHYKKPAQRFGKRSKTLMGAKSSKPIARVRVPRLGGNANLAPFVESGARMRAARAVRLSAKNGIKERVASAFKNLAASIGLLAPPSDVREARRESERTADYVAAHAADDDLFVY